MKTKYVSVEYIESGTFVGGEEDCFNAEIEQNKEYVVISKSDFVRMKKELKQSGCVEFTD